jgi:hypothetical protein
MKHLRKHTQRQSNSPTSQGDNPNAPDAFEFPSPCSEPPAQACSPWLRVAEPFWMQDIRLAQRKIDEARLAAQVQRAIAPEDAGRSADSDQAAS